jgi:hypothetical protein
MKSKSIGLNEVVNELEIKLEDSGINISRAVLEVIVNIVDEIRCAHLIENEVIDMKFCSLYLTTRRINDKISKNEGYTVKIKGILNKDIKSICMNRLKLIK